MLTQYDHCCYRFVVLIELFNPLSRPSSSEVRSVASFRAYPQLVQRCAASRANLVIHGQLPSSRQ